MKHKSKDVTAATNPRHMPATHNINTPRAVREQDPTPARRAPIAAPTPASGFGETGIRSRESAPPSFELPKTVSARQIQQDSFQYGGGRSAGSRSLAANINRKVNLP
jgi:hypothetical protein